MQIQVNTDNYIEGSTELTREVEEKVENSLGRFDRRITRVEVHLHDENSDAKQSSRDKRCVMEARVTGHQPITVSHNGPSIGQAINGAAHKLERTLDRTFGRLNDRKPHTPMSGGETT